MRLPFHHHRLAAGPWQRSFVTDDGWNLNLGGAYWVCMTSNAVVPRFSQCLMSEPLAAKQVKGYSQMTAKTPDSKAATRDKIDHDIWRYARCNQMLVSTKDQKTKRRRDTKSRLVLDTGQESPVLYSPGPVRSRFRALTRTGQSSARLGCRLIIFLGGLFFLEASRESRNSALTVLIFLTARPSNHSPDLGPTFPISRIVGMRRRSGGLQV